MRERFVGVVVACGMAGLAVAQSPTQWRRVLPTVPNPEATHRHLLYDEVRQQCVLVAATGTYAWDGQTWALIGHGMTFGTSGGDFAVAFDPIRRTPMGFTSNAETIAFDGSNWSVVAVGPLAGRYSHALVTDSARSRVVIYGGNSNSGDPNDAQYTWEWDGVRWDRRATTGPGHRDHHAMCYDSTRGRVVLYGKDNNTPGDTWEWDGTTWGLRASSGPPSREAMAMAFDQSRGRTVLYGGQYSDGTTWEWDGLVWSRSGATGPGYREYPAMAYDAARRRVVMTTAWPEAETWELDCAPVVLRLSEQVEVGAGQTATMYVIAEGSGQLNYEWRKDGQPVVDSPRVVGSHSPVLSIRDASLDDMASYSVRVSDACGEALSGDVPLVVFCQADTNRDGFLDFFDYDDFVRTFEEGC